MEISKFTNKKWVIQGAVITPHLNAFAVDALTKGLQDITGHGLSVILTFMTQEGEYSHWVLDEESLNTEGKWYDDHPEELKKLFMAWEKARDVYYEYIEGIMEKGVTDPITEYKQFREHYQNAYAHALVTEHFIVWGDKILATILEKIPKEKRKQVEILTAPIKHTFLNDEELGLLKIGLQFKQTGKISEEDLKKHTKKFFWIRNNYKNTKPMSLQEFEKRLHASIAELTEKQVTAKIAELETYEQDLIKKKEQAREKLGLAKEDEEKLELLSLVAWWHDQRKKGNLLGDHVAGLFFEKAAKDHTAPLIDIKFMLPDEFLKFLETGEYNKDEIQERKKACVYITANTGEKSMHTGKTYEELSETVLEQEYEEKIKDVRGMTASYGHAKGPVKVVLNPKDTDIEKGDVLVTSMTRPEYVPLMKKAAAIVTDEGGVTSHAAVISRELGIPCIVGTRIGTKVLKDGMVVEVRCNHGLVKICD